MMSPSIAVLLWLSGLMAPAQDAPQPPPVKEPELRAELLGRVKADQDARSAMVQWSKAHRMNDAGTILRDDERAEFEKMSAELKAIDEDNTAWLRGVVEKHGWPTYTLVGKDGAGAAWLLIQHADHDPGFQRRCLDLMAVLPKDQVAQQNLAYLTDRVLLAEGKKQLYGTQFALTDGQWKPRPIEDEANVDPRRAEVGLPPLADYAQMLAEEFGGSGKARSADPSPVPVEGAPAPAFTLPGPDGQPVALDQLRGKWVVLYFYPKDFTSGCTLQAQNFQRDIGKYEKANAVIIGVSVDSVDSHKDFCAKEGLSFRLLADTDRRVSSQYGSLMTHEGVQYSARNTFVIDPAGVLRKTYLKVTPAGHSEEVLADLTAFQAAP